VTAANAAVDTAIDPAPDVILATAVAKMMQVNRSASS
jgi:hypothetical protein